VWIEQPDPRTAAGRRERERRKKKAQKTNETPDESRCFSRFSKYLLEASSFSARMTFNSPSK
jgi:hypothetical protein